MKKKTNNKRHAYMKPCIWTSPMISHATLLAGSELKTTINQDYANEDGRSNGWSGFNEDDTGSHSNFWDD